MKSLSKGCCVSFLSFYFGHFGIKAKENIYLCSNLKNPLKRYTLFQKKLRESHALQRTRDRISVYFYACLPVWPNDFCV